MNYTIYNADGSWFGTFGHVDPAMIPEGGTSVEGAHDQYTRLVSTGALSAVTPFSQAELDEIEADQELADRREERRLVFSGTLDKMNPIWFGELSSTEQDDLREWRRLWLDYPATGTKPDDLDIFDR